MSEHLPECFCAKCNCDVADDCCICDRLRAARADERERAAERVEALPNTWGDWVDQEQAAAAVRHE